MAQAVTEAYKKAFVGRVAESGGPEGVGVGGVEKLGDVGARGWRWLVEADKERLVRYYEGERGLRARRIAEGKRMEQQADKAREWFVKQKEKLNEMVREHLARLPKDVGQPLTARPNAKNG